MSRLRNLVQAAVVKTNPVVPFSYLNKAPYWLALYSFERLCRTFPEIHGVYLRHGMTQSDWVPGISDIDLTVTFSGGRSLEEEFSFLSRICAKHAALRRVFPMLTDVLILDEEHLAAWTLFGIRGYEARRWKTLSGESPECAHSGGDVSRDAIDDAIYRYFDFLLAWYSEPASFLTLHRMQRVASRILRCAPVDLVPTQDPALLTARVLLGLDRWIRGFEGHTPAADCGHEGEVEESIVVRGDICLVVLDGRPNEESIRQSLVRLQDQTGGRRVRVVTRRILRYWMREWHPRQYQDWVTESQLVSGPDVLAEMEAPGEEAYVRSLLNLTSLILSFPQLEMVVLQRRAAWFAGDAFLWLVLRGWYLRLYLETGIHSPTHKQNMNDIQRQYPESVKELGEIREAAVAEGYPLSELRFRSFCLLKETATAVNRALAAVPATGFEPRARAASA